jgi:hypothetical protein
MTRPTDAASGSTVRTTRPTKAPTPRSREAPGPTVATAVLTAPSFTATARSVHHVGSPSNDTDTRTDLIVRTG